MGVSHSQRSIGEINVFYRLLIARTCARWPLYHLYPVFSLLVVWRRSIIMAERNHIRASTSFRIWLYGYFIRVNPIRKENEAAVSNITAAWPCKT